MHIDDLDLLSLGPFFCLWIEVRNMAAEGPQMTSRRLLVDKEHLSKAVKLVDNERFINFACAQQLLLNEFPLNAVRVENLGVVKLPVSLQVN